MSKTTRNKPSTAEQTFLDEVRVLLLPERKDRQRFQRLLNAHHYLGGLKAVGEQLYYVAVDAKGRWLFRTFPTFRDRMSRRLNQIIRRAAGPNP